MPRRPAVGLLCASLLFMSPCPGCSPATGPESSASASGPDYGPNKMPPAEKVAPKSGRAPGSPGAPPLKR